LFLLRVIICDMKRLKWIDIKNEQPKNHQMVLFTVKRIKHHKAEWVDDRWVGGEDEIYLEVEKGEFIRDDRGRRQFDGVHVPKRHWGDGCTFYTKEVVKWTPLPEPHEL